MPVAEDFLADVKPQSAEDFLGEEQQAAKPSGFLDTLFPSVPAGKEVPLPSFESPRGILPPTKEQTEYAHLLQQGIEPTEGGTRIQVRPPGGEQAAFYVPTVTPPAEAGVGEKMAAGAWNVLAGIPNFLATPGGMSTLMAPAILPHSVAGPVLKGTFMGLMSHQAGEQAGEVTAGIRPGMTIPQALRTVDPQQAVEAAGTALMVPLTGLAGGKGPEYASRQQKAAEVHGPVQPQPVQGAGQVPAQEGGPGVRPPAPPVAEGTQIPLKKGPTYLTGQRGEVGEDLERGWYVQFGNRREYGFETVFEAKRVLDEVESGQRTIVGEMVPMPEDNIAGATYTDPETGETTIAPHHPGAAEEQGVDAEGPREEREGPEFGFVTETGEPLTRPEAEVKAGQTGQAMPEVQKKPGVPHSDEIKAAGTEAPISETSDLDQIMDKIERGHKLTPAEEALFDAQISSPGTKPKPNQLELALKKEASKVSKKVDVKDEPPTPDATVPFASNIVYLDPKSGRLVVNRKEFLDTMSKIPQHNHKAYIERLVNEEHVHSKVSDADAKAFFGNATATERALAFKQYTGFDTNEQLFKARGTRLSDTALGHEMVRQRIQQLSHMGVREIIELSGREKWNARFIDSLQRLIYNLRKALGTRASRIQQDIINRMQGNLDAVKAERGEPKGAFKKGGEEEPVPDIAAMASEVGFSTFDKRLNEFLDREGLPRNSWPAEARKNVFEALQAVAGNKEAEDIAVKEAQARLQAEKGLTEMGLPPGKITAARQRLLDKVKKTLRPPEQPLGAFAKRPPEEMSEPIRGFAGELTAGRVRTREAVQAGLGARSIDDLNDLANLRQEWGQKATEAREKGFPAETMQDVFKAQYPREAIEAATNTGSHQEHEISHGPRPLDWREHPEVADWLQKNAKSLGITLPDELGQTVPGAMKKETKAEREARIARERATESLPGFGGPAYSQALPLKGERPPPPPETERATTGFEGVTPKWLEGDLGSYMAKTDAPSFKDWVEDLNARSIRVAPEQVASVYEDAMWQHLTSAPGEKLTAMAKALGVDVNIISRKAKELGKRQLTNVPDPAAVEQDRMIKAVLEGGPREQRSAGELGVGDLTKEDLKQLQKTRESRQRFRNRVITAIASKMMAETLPPERPLRRDTVGIEDVAWSDPRATEGPFYKFTNQEANNPQMVSAITGDQSRRSAKEPETITRRLLVLVDKNTGKVEVADAYKARAGLMVMRPTIAGISAHRPLTQLPKSLRPLYTLLLKDPVQNFHQSFKTVADFNEHFDIEEATRRNQASEYGAIAGEGPLGSFALPEATDVERTPTEEGGEEVTFRPATKGEGGMFAGGPGGREARAMVSQRPGEIGRAEDFPLSANEASALFRVADQNEVSEPEDFKAMVDIIAERARQRGSLRGDHASALAALDKIVAVTHQDLQDAWRDEAAEMKKLRQPFDVPPPTEKEAYEVALRDIFHALTRSKGYADYIQTLLGDYRREPKPPVQLTAPTPVPTAGRTEGVSREVTMRQPPPRMPPTRFPLPRTAEEPLAKAPEQLPAGAVPGVEAHAAAEFPYTPTGEAEKLVETGKPTGRILKYGAPEFRTKSKLVGPRQEEPIGAFYKRPMDKGEEVINQATRGIVAMVKRDTAFDEIAAGRDRASNQANNFANKIGNFLRRKAGAREAKGLKETLAGKVWQGDPEKKAASIAVEQAGFDYDKLAEFRLQASRGMDSARDLIKNGNWWQKIKGRKWLEYQGKLMKLIDYADEHWDDPDLQDLAKSAHAELDAQYAREIRAGHNVKYDPDYVPGRYEAEFYNGNATVFGQLHDVLGRNWKAPKTFRSYFEASAEEPYLAKSLDIADIVEHRVRQGMNRINYDNWVNGLKNISDKDSGKMVAANMVRRPDKSLAPPSAEYVGMPLRRGYQWIAVHKGYEPLIRDLTNSSAIQNNIWGHNALQAAQALKHTMLIGDVFHLGRVAYYGMSLQRRVAAKFRGGLAALEWREQDLPEAVRAGLVSPEQAKWATEKINVNVGGGQTVPMSRIQIADLGLKSGLNNGRILDALYKETVGWVPGVGRYNRWLFDRVTRGFITQSFVHQFEKLNASHPNLDASVLARDVAKDINAYFGNIGRQGWFKSETYQDLARLAFLAPQWVEGLVKKEVGFYSRLARAPVGGRGELPRLGALGSGIATGLVTMIGITQALNLLFRKQPTWMNEEKGHKFDAFIRTGGPDEGYWFSPLAVFNELSHDVVRLIETKPKLWDVFSQIGENKLSPYGRLGMIAARSQTPTGQYLSTTPGVMGAMANQLIPTPISASKPLQALGHAVAPGMVPALKPGALGRQLAATAGLKIEPNAAPAQQAHALADDFMLANPELKKDSGWLQVQTDEPNYSKLRSSIRSGDDAHALQQFEELRKTRKYQDIVRAMKLASRRPFTGSHANERRFLYTLTPQQLDLYSRAQEQRQAEYEAFVAWLSRSEAQ